MKPTQMILVEMQKIQNVSVFISFIAKELHISRQAVNKAKNKALKALEEYYR